MYGTEQVKIERYNDCELSVCQACLSSDRIVSSLGEYVDVYQNICSNSYSIQSELYFCWECIAMLKRIKLFKEKLRQAQRILRYQYIDQQNRPKTCLSKLTTTKINTENIIICHNEEDSDNKYNIQIKQEIDFENEPLDHNNCSEEIKLEDEELTHTFQKFDCDLNRKKDRAKKYRMILKTTEGRASKKIKIRIDELDGWLTRERNSNFYKNLVNKCDKCVTNLSRKESLDEHNKSYHHETVGRYSCDICQTHFATKSSLTSHVASHYYIRHCNICGYECYTSGHMKNHMDGHKKTVQCLYCHVCYNNVRQFYKHYKAMHCLYICDHCDKRCKSKHSLEKHMRKVKNKNDKNYESESGKRYKKKLQKQLFEQQESPRADVKSEPESDINTSQRKKKSKRKRNLNGDEKIQHEDSYYESYLDLLVKQEQASFTAPLSINHSLESYFSESNLIFGELANDVLEIEWCKDIDDSNEVIKIEDTLSAEETVEDTSHTAPEHQYLNKSNRTDDEGSDNTEIIKIEDKFSAEETAVETRQKMPKHKDLTKSHDNYLAFHAKQEQTSSTVTPSKQKRKKHRKVSNSNLDDTNNESESSCTKKSKKKEKKTDSNLNDIEANTNLSELVNDGHENECCKDIDDSTEIIKIDDTLSAEETVEETSHPAPTRQNLTKSNIFDSESSDSTIIITIDDKYSAEKTAVETPQKVSKQKDSIELNAKQKQTFTVPASIKHKKHKSHSDPNLNSTANETEPSNIKNTKKSRKKKKRDGDLENFFKDSNTKFSQLANEFMEIGWCKEDDSTEKITIEDTFSTEESVLETPHKVPKQKDLAKSNDSYIAFQQDQASFTVPSCKHKQSFKKQKSDPKSNLDSTNDESDSSNIKKSKKRKKKKKIHNDLDESFCESKLDLGELKKEFLEIGWFKDNSNEIIKIEDTLSAEETVVDTPHTGLKHQDLIKSTIADSEGSDNTEITTIDDKFSAEKTALETGHKVSKHKDLIKPNTKQEQTSAAPSASIKHKKHKRHSDANLNSTNKESESESIKNVKKSRKKKKKDRDRDESFDSNVKLGQLANEFIEIGWCRDDSTEKIIIEDTLSAEETVLKTPHKTPICKDLTKTDNESIGETEIITIEDKFTEKKKVKIRHKKVKHNDLTKSNRADSEGTDESTEIESSEIKSSVTYNNSDDNNNDDTDDNSNPANDSGATVIGRNEITETPAPDPRSDIKLPRNIRFDEDNTDDSGCVMSSRIRQYVKNNPHLRPCEPQKDSIITDDDEVWILKVQRDFDITNLKGTDILLEKDREAKMKVDGQIYKGRVDDSIDKINLITSEHSKFVLKIVPIMGTVHFHPRIPKVRYMNEDVMWNNKTEFIPLPEIKPRHPLFGHDYETAMEIPESVRARLKNAEAVKKSSCTEKKKDKHSEVVQLNAELLRPSGHHTKKKNTNSVEKEPVSKKRRITERSDDIWDSEQEIEKTLFKL